jgi:hypothetical protein
MTIAVREVTAVATINEAGTGRVPSVTVRAVEAIVARTDSPTRES